MVCCVWMFFCTSHIVLFFGPVKLFVFSCALSLLQVVLISHSQGTIIAGDVLWHLWKAVDDQTLTEASIGALLGWWLLKSAFYWYSSSSRSSAWLQLLLLIAFPFETNCLCCCYSLRRWGRALLAQYEIRGYGRCFSFPLTMPRYPWGPPPQPTGEGSSKTQCWTTETPNGSKPYWYSLKAPNRY